MVQVRYKYGGTTEKISIDKEFRLGFKSSKGIPIQTTARERHK